MLGKSLGPMGEIGGVLGPEVEDVWEGKTLKTTSKLNRKAKYLIRSLSFVLAVDSFPKSRIHGPNHFTVGIGSWGSRSGDTSIANSVGFKSWRWNNRRW